MSKKIILALLVSLFFSFSPIIVSAQKPEDWEPPEKNGVYDVPGHKNLKVRVFVHEPQNKPVQILSCTDPDSTAVVDPVGWKLPSTWSWYLNTSSVPSSITGNVSTIAANSIKTWQDELKSKVKFEYKGLTLINKKAYDGKNIIAWGRTLGSALGVTYTWYYPGLAVETDTIMNLKFPWSWTPYPGNNFCSLYPTTYDAQDILTHELGHWVGLDDHYTSAYVDNTMFGYGSKGEIKKDTLTTGDKTSVALLY